MMWPRSSLKPRRLTICGLSNGSISSETWLAPGGDACAFFGWEVAWLLYGAWTAGLLEWGGGGGACRRFWIGEDAVEFLGVELLVCRLLTC